MVEEARLAGLRPPTDSRRAYRLTLSYPSAKTPSRRSCQIRWYDRPCSKPETMLSWKGLHRLAGPECPVGGLGRFCLPGDLIGIRPWIAVLFNKKSLTAGLPGIAVLSWRRWAGSLCK